MVFCINKKKVIKVSFLNASFFRVWKGGEGVSRQYIEPRMLVTLSCFCFDVMTDSILKCAFLNGIFFFTLRIHIFAIIQDIACRVICSTNSSVADFLQVVLDNGYKAPNSCAEAVSKLFPENDRAGQVTLDIGAGTGLLAEEVSRVTSTLVLKCYNSAISVTKKKKKKKLSHNCRYGKERAFYVPFDCLC